MSKAFDRVDHRLLFSELSTRGLHLVIVRFLILWYKQQEISVQWNGICLAGFGVSNGDGLLYKLKESGVGCYWGCRFVGGLCYADDLVLLAPSVSALRMMLSICETFALSHGLKFNSQKTQRIRFNKHIPIITL